MIKNLTKTERAVLDYFFQKPGQNIHIRGLSKELDITYSSVVNALSSLEQKGFLESDEKSKMKFYSIAGEKFREAKRLVNLENLQDSNIISHIEKELRPEAVVLFGSYLEGQDTEESDIDLAVIGGRQKGLELGKFEEDLGRKTQITRIENPKNEDKEFKNTLANGFVLSGYLEVV